MRSLSDVGAIARIVADRDQSPWKRTTSSWPSRASEAMPARDAAIRSRATSSNRSTGTGIS
jgi:hypothetical protein